MLPFTCAHCGKNYCVEHRLPENHKCSNTPKAPPPYISPIVSKEEAPEVKTSKLGLCPQCHRCSDKIVDYDAKIITFQCEYCSFKFSQLKATPHDYVEPPEKPEPTREPIRIEPTPMEPTIKQKHFPLKKVLALLTIAVVIGVAVWSAPQFLSPTTPAVSPSTSPSSHSMTTPTPNISQTNYSQEELVNYALSLINSDRNGLSVNPNGTMIYRLLPIGEKHPQNVSLSAIISAQQHAEDMLKNNYFSHWDTHGYKPHMRYTLAGGQGSVSENIAWIKYGFWYDLKAAIAKLEFDMINDDAEWDWGHRDNILNPFHNKVSIGIAYNSTDLYLVQDFEDNYVSWSTLTVSYNGVTMKGTIKEPGLSISQVQIHYDNVATLTSQQLANAPYNGSYDAGTYVGLAVSEGWEAKEGITITATTWSQIGSDFNIVFDPSPAFAQCGKGVYTLYLWTDSNKCLTSFSIWN
jgi:hypothetical protein